MTQPFQFTFANLEAQYSAALSAGYRFFTCAEYASRTTELPPKSIVHRVDVDYSLKKADRLRAMFDRLGITATFFVRLHAPEYNPFAFEEYRVMQAVRDGGHEIGYHSEIVDQAAIWGEDAAECLRRDIDVLNRMLGIRIKGIASHGGETGLNNLDFWKDRQASEFGLLYEAYDRSPMFNLFYDSFYVSDSEWTRWKCYNRGVLCEGDRRSFQEHLVDEHQLIYFLIHPDTYFDRHFYE
jgi:hypothetical protein